MNIIERIKAESERVISEHASKGKTSTREDKAAGKEAATLYRYVQILARVPVHSIASQLAESKKLAASLNSRKTEWCSNNSKKCNGKSNTAITGMFKTDVGLRKIEADIKFMSRLLNTVKRLDPSLF